MPSLLNRMHQDKKDKGGSRDDEDDLEDNGDASSTTRTTTHAAAIELPPPSPPTSPQSSSHSSAKFTRRQLGSVAALCVIGMLGYRGTSTFWSRSTTNLNYGSLEYKPASLESTQYGPIGQLRWNWTNLPVQSQLAKEFQQHQTNCNLPLHYFPSRNAAGLGSDMHVYGMALCHAHRTHKRMFTPDPWMYVSHEDCDAIRTSHSAMSCYFPTLELQCPGDELRAMQVWNASRAMQDINPRLHRITWENHEDMSCQSIVKRPGYDGLFTIMDVRAAITEFQFSNVAEVVIKEAQRQHSLVFPNGAPPPYQLVTVHIRWGDKGSEMKLQPVRKYIKAVQKVANERNLQAHEVHIFLATEDPRAVQEFTVASPKAWTIHVDQFMYDMLPHRNNRTMEVAGAAKLGNGKTGLLALGSMLVSMEADSYVLSTGSNWSRLMNELRKAVVRARKCPTPHHPYELPVHHQQSDFFNKTSTAMRHGDCTSFLDVQPSHSPYETGNFDPRSDKHDIILAKLKLLQANHLEQKKDGKGGSVLGFGRHKIPTAPPRKWTQFNENAPRIKPDSLRVKEQHIKTVKYPRLQRRKGGRRGRQLNVR